MKILNLAAMACLLFGLPAALSADTVLEYTRKSEYSYFESGATRTSHRQWTATYDEGRARIDDKSHSYILRADLGKFWLLSHRSRTFTELSVPIRLERYLSAEERETAKLNVEMGAPIVDVTPTAESKKIGLWQAKLWQISVMQPELEIVRDFELWLSPEFPGAAEVYLELRQIISQLDFAGRAWREQISALDGLPVMSVSKEHFPPCEVLGVVTLMANRQVDLAGEDYEIPSDYTEAAYKPEFKFRPLSTLPPIPVQ
jgi:hypothetical protein